MKTSDIYAIIGRRCMNCHSEAPSHQGFTSAPLGIELDSPEKLLQHAEMVYQAVVVTRTMPLANLTQMTDSERNLVASWFEGLSPEPR